MFFTSMVAASTTRCCAVARPPLGASVEYDDGFDEPDESSVRSGRMTVNSTTTSAMASARNAAATIAGTRLRCSVLVSTMISLAQPETTKACDQLTSPAVRISYHDWSPRIGPPPVEPTLIVFPVVTRG